MELHFTAKYNMEYLTRTPCEVETSIKGILHISKDIHISTFKSADEWLEHFVDADLFFGNLDDIHWNSFELKDLREMLKHNQLNESINNK